MIETKLDCVGVTGEVGKISEEMIPAASSGYRDLPDLPTPEEVREMRSKNQFQHCPECGCETFWMSGVAISRTAICCRCRETICFAEGTVFMLSR